LVQVIAPHRARQEYGGTEFAPGEHRDLLLVADETALPALTRIIADIAPGFTGHAFFEVPSAEDVLSLDVAANIEVTWLMRDDAEQGRRLVQEVRRFLGLGALDPRVLPAALPSDLDVEVWETPRYSSAGEDATAQVKRPVVGSDRHGLYAWIAGESWMVKALRRSPVTELELDRAGRLHGLLARGRLDEVVARPDASHSARPVCKPGAPSCA
jgi:NADPH-dependent ferric siderophore reductase